MRDQEQARLTDHAYGEALRILTKHRALLDRVAQALLEQRDARRARSCSRSSATSSPSRAPPRRSAWCASPLEPEQLTER